MTVDNMKFLLEGSVKVSIQIMEIFLEAMSDDEFNKIQTLKLSDEEVSFIERNATVIYVMREGMDEKNYKDYAVYFTGGMPFKVYKQTKNSIT
jgi:hypothetical protein